MENNLTVTCPQCKKVFSAKDLLQDHFKEKEKETKDLLENQQKEFKKKEAEIEKNLKNQISKNYETQLKEQLKEKEAQLKSQILIENKKIQEDSDKRIKLLSEQLENQEKQKKDLEKKFNTSLKETEKKLQAKIVEDLEKKYENESKKKEKEIEISNKRLRQKLEEAEKQLKQRSMEVQGEVQEELIEDYLSRKFPSDNVVPIKKGQKGGDCILVIKSNTGEEIGKIYFESKDQKSFSEDWPNKLLNDMKDKNIGYGVLITVSLPKDFDKSEGFTTRHGKRVIIIPFNKPLIHSIVSFLRSGLIEESKNQVDFDGSREMKRLWEHITSHEFALSIRKLALTIVNMRQLIEKEKKFYETNIASKENALLDMQDELKDLVLSFRKKVGQVLPENLLENNPFSEVKVKSEYSNNINIKKTSNTVSEDFLTVAKINIHEEWLLSIKTFAALKDFGIIFVGDLIAYSEANLLKSRNFGKKSLEELEHYMQKYSLSFETSIDNWEIIREDLI